MPALVLKLLGGFEASVMGGPALALSSKTGQALLAFLALNPDRRHSRDRLAALLWEDRGDEQARTSLRQTLAQLRKTLPADAACLQAEGEWLAFDPSACALDIAEFEQAAGRSDAASLGRAASLYRGELLEGFNLRGEAFTDWLRGERTRLRERGLQVLRTLLTLQSTAETTAAIATAGRLLTLDPADETAHRALMQLHAAEGRRDAALRQYYTCRETLRRELDVAPQPETEALYQTLLTRSAATAVPVSAPVKPAKTDMPSIVVLPFVNQGGGSDDAHLADGITEDIIIELARFRDLLVIARSSAFQFRGQAADIATIRQKLGVRYVVEGSLRKIGDRIRISAQLIDGETAGTLWAEHYDRRQDDIFDLQDQLAVAIAATLEGRIVARAAERVRKKPTTEWDAYDCFLQGRELMHRYRSAESEAHFTRAIESDPAYAHAYALRSAARTSKYVIGGCRDQTLLASALADAQHALSLDDGDGWCHTAMGYTLLWYDRMEDAGNHFDRAVALNPNDVDIACDRANWLLCTDRLDEALATLDSAMRRDPFPPTWAWEVRGSVLYRLQRYEEALAAYRHVDAEYFWMPAFMAACYGQLGRKEEAARALQGLLRLKPDVTVSTYGQYFSYPERRNWRDHVADGLRKAGLPE